MKIPHYLQRYWLAMNATAFDSAIHSAAAYCSAAGAHAAAQDLGWQVAQLHLQQLMLVFLGSFGWGILRYLAGHPVAQLVAAGATETLDKERNAHAG